MTNKRKVQLYRENKCNPLRKEYLKEYKEITTGSLFGSVWIINFILIFGIGFILFLLAANECEPWDVIVTVIGVINLVIMFLSQSMDGGKLAKTTFSQEIKELNKKYKKLGFIYDDIDSVIFGSCYDFDNNTNIFTCPFTGDEYFGIDGNKKCVSNGGKCPIKEKFLSDEYER